MNFVETLRKRGMLHDIMAGTEEVLLKERTGGYIGFDPTATSLHIGNLATIMLLKWLQRAGHRPYIVIGGATGMVGDPSFKSKERVLLSEEAIRHNQGCIQKQMMRFLDFEGENGAVMVNNYDWFQGVGFLDFLRDIGKHITVNYMMNKEAVKSRLQSGISYTEFAYPLLQAYDFLHLYKEHGVKLQMGGSDQWGNIITGAELIRRKVRGSGYALTTPLITKGDGSKFGKTESGNVWLDGGRTSPYAFYQFWLNVDDTLAPKLIRRMTFLPLEEIAACTQEHERAPHKRVLQRRLAREMMVMVHTEGDWMKAVRASEVLFGKEEKGAFASLDEEAFLGSLEGIPTITLSEGQISESPSLVDLLSHGTGQVVCGSRREAREIIAAGGLRLNRVKVSPEEGGRAPALSWLYDRYILVRKGKKNFYLVKRAV